MTQMETRKNTHHTEADLLTVAEVADILRVDNTTVRRWVKQGALKAIILPHVNQRHAYRIRRGTLDTITAGQFLSPKENA